MIPKSKRRVIVVNGTTYEYCICRCVEVYIKNLTTKKEFTWWEEWKPKWKQALTPKNIRQLILDNHV